MKRFVKSSYDPELSFADDDMDISYGILIRNNFTGRYGIIQYGTEGTAKRWYKKILDNAGNRYTQMKAMRAGVLWEDISLDDIDQHGVWSRRPYDFGIVLLNPEDALLFDEWGT